jgi:hypothetical protein
MNEFNYSSIYAPYFKQFIVMKKVLGYVSLRNEWVFLEFDNFFIANNITTIGITRQQVEQWRATRINDSLSTVCTKYSILSQFCRYIGKNAQKIQSSAEQIDHPPKGLLKGLRQSQIWASGGVN